MLEIWRERRESWMAGRCKKAKGGLMIERQSGESLTCMIEKMDVREKGGKLAGATGKNIKR